MYITNQEFYDGDYSYHPSATTFLNLEDELEYLHSSEIELDWATRRIKQGILDWVSSAVVIKKVFRLRLWQEKYSDWKDYCHRAIGKKAEMIRVMLDRADVVIELAKAGFEVLPTNQSQVASLMRCCKKLDCMIYDAWEKVLNSLAPSFITADSIAEVLGFPCENERIPISKEIGDRLSREALDRGMSRRELHEQILDDWLSEQDDVEEVEETEPDKIEAWQADLDELVAEHDRELWLLCTFTKLANFARRSTSQFSWLHNFRYQT